MRASDVRKLTMDLRTSDSVPKQLKLIRVRVEKLLLLLLLYGKA